MAKQWSLGSNLPQLSAIEVVDTLSKWEGVEETITLFGDMIKDEQSKQSSDLYASTKQPNKEQRTK